MFFILKFFWFKRHKRWSSRMLFVLCTWKTMQETSSFRTSWRLYVILFCIEQLFNVLIVFLQRLLQIQMEWMVPPVQFLELPHSNLVSELNVFDSQGHFLFDIHLGKMSTTFCSHFTGWCQVEPSAGRLRWHYVSLSELVIFVPRRLLRSFQNATLCVFRCEHISLHGNSFSPILHRS